MARKKNSSSVGTLDSIQAVTYKHFPQEKYLSDEKKFRNVIDWITFYRRNLHRFALHYLGLKLYLYQAYMLFKINNASESVVVAARTAAKSFVIAIFACCKAILYPNSQIVIASATKKQAELIIKEKIEKELMPASPNLRKEIRAIYSNSKDTYVDFYNGSTITVVVANDNARGHRSTLMIYEEFRMIKKFIIDSVLSPFQHVRNTDYKDMPEYSHLPSEESSSVFISSAWYRHHWMWQTVLDAGKRFAEGDKGAFFMALDYCIPLYHKIKTKKQLIELKRRLDPVTWKIECENVMIGENAHSFFTYDLFDKNQKLKRPMYPRTIEEVMLKKKGAYVLPHQDGEVRILAVDMAFIDKSGNDNSIFSVIRLLPERVAVSEGMSLYRKQVSYIESIHGGDTANQAMRIKRLFYDMECDYCVLDTRNGGISVYDMLARVMWDEESQTEYKPWTCMNDDNISDRVRSEGAEKVLFAVNATQRLNSEIAMLTRRELAEGRVDILIPHSQALDDVLPSIKEYKSSIDLDDQLFYEKPYLETQAFINESIDLIYEKIPDTGIIKISEQGTKTKDRYTSVSYGLYFASLLERENSIAVGEYEYVALYN